MENTLILKQLRHLRFLAYWCGTRWKCVETGEILVIGDNVRYRDCFFFGNCMIDVGDGYYSRGSGNYALIESSYDWMLDDLQDMISKLTDKENKDEL